MKKISLEKTSRISRRRYIATAIVAFAALLAGTAYLVATGSTDSVDDVDSTAPSEASKLDTLVQQAVAANPGPDRQVQTIPYWQWVDVLNKDEYEGYHDRCGIEPGASLIEIGPVGDQMLVQYREPDGSLDSGSPCDGDEIFLVPTDSSSGMIGFNDMTAEYERQKMKSEKLNADVQAVIANPVPNPRVKTVLDWEWVGDLGSPTLYPAEGEACGIEAKGTLTEIGPLGEGTLVKYGLPPGHSEYDTAGTPCDGGEIFVIQGM